MREKKSSLFALRRFVSVSSDVTQKLFFFFLSDICLDLILNVVQDVDRQQQLDQDLLKEVSKCSFTYSRMLVWTSIHGREKQTHPPQSFPSGW